MTPPPRFSEAQASALSDRLTVNAERLASLTRELRAHIEEEGHGRRAPNG